MATGELIHRCLPPETDTGMHGQRRRLLLVTGLLSASFPDLDLVLTPLLPPPLGYLLHHRGHTHTFLYLLPQALLLAALLTLLWPSARRLLLQSRTAVTGFCLSLAAGLVLHILMDFLNSYGIHPFYPFDPGWYYGDMIFIIEPVFWVAFGVPLLMMVRRRWLRLAGMAVLAGALVYFTLRGFLLWQSLAMLAFTGAVLALVQYRSAGRSVAGILTGLAAALVFIGAQALASHEARQVLASQLQVLEPDTQVLDAAMTAFPTNPACWMFASIERSGEHYRARRGVLSILPASVAASDCPAAFAAVPPELQDDYSPVAVLFTHRSDLQDLQRLYEQDCHFRAWMRFARIPAHRGGQAEDIRYARTEENFAAIDLDSRAAMACPDNVPQWGVPRMDLLQPAVTGKQEPRKGL